MQGTQSGFPYSLGNPPNMEFCLFPHQSHYRTTLFVCTCVKQQSVLFRATGRISKSGLISQAADSVMQRLRVASLVLIMQGESAEPVGARKTCISFSVSLVLHSMVSGANQAVSTTSFAYFWFQIAPNIFLLIISKGTRRKKRV